MSVFNGFYYFKGFPHCSRFFSLSLSFRTIFWSVLLAEEQFQFPRIFCYYIRHIFRMRIVHFQLVWCDYLPVQKKAKSCWTIHCIKSGNGFASKTACVFAQGFCILRSWQNERTNEQDEKNTNTRPYIHVRMIFNQNQINHSREYVM